MNGPIPEGAPSSSWMVEAWRFQLPTRIVFGAGTSAQAGAAAASFGRRATLVTGASSFDDLPTSGTILRSLAEAGVTLVGHLRQGSEPDDETVSAVAQHLQSSGTDVVVAVGGGSVLDAAKAAAVVAGLGTRVERLLGGDRIEAPIGIPVVALPTTGGSGAEVSHGAIVLDRTARRKRGVRGSGVAPRVAIVDPSSLVTAGAKVTASSGFDAVAHAIETFVSNAASPLTRALSAEALTRLLAALPAALEDPAALPARAETAYAALLMGMNLANSTTCLPHRLQYPVGALTGTSHPRGVAALMPAWLSRTRSVAPGRLAELARAAGIAPEGATVDEAATRLDEAIGSLLDGIGLRITLTDLGVTETDLPTLVAATEGSLAMDPGPVDEDSLLALYRASL